MGRTEQNLGKIAEGSPEELRFRSYFGVSAPLSVEAWEMMEVDGHLPPNPKFLHFLWALAFMRTYPANDKALSTSLGGGDPKTLRKHLWPFIRSLFALNETVVSSLCLLGVGFYISHSPSWPQIKFENRKRGDIGNDCLLSVDGTDFRIAMGYVKSFWSYKFKKSGLRYEVGLCIRTGDICWWVGPYAPGVWNDNMIFNDALVSALEPGERCETDRGYQGSAPIYAKCPGVVEADPATAEVQQRVRSRQETVNKRFKNWAILSTPYRHDFLEHQTVFGAIVVLTQLSFATHPLFQVEY